MKKKIVDLFSSKDGLSMAYSLRLNSGGRTFRLRKLINSLNAEMVEFGEFRKGLMEKSGLTKFDQSNPVVQELNKQLEEASQEPTKTEIEPMIEMMDLDDVKISALEIDQLISIGLLKDPDAKEDPEKMEENPDRKLKKGGK